MLFWQFRCNMLGKQTTWWIRHWIWSDSRSIFLTVCAETQRELAEPTGTRACWLSSLVCDGLYSWHKSPLPKYYIVLFTILLRLIINRCITANCFVGNSGYWRWYVCFNRSLLFAYLLFFASQSSQNLHSPNVGRDGGAGGGYWCKIASFFCST